MKNGFTLVEILVVIAIIGILSAVAFASYYQAKEQAFMAQRIEAAGELQKALELYHTDHQSYPVTPNGSTWYSDSCATYAQPDWIPGLVSGGYIASLPKDPEYPGTYKDAGGNTGTDFDACCYMYRSNGADYKLMFGYQCSTDGHTTTPDNITHYGAAPEGLYKQYASLVDPRRDNGYDLCAQETNKSIYALAHYTAKACNW